MKWGWEMIQRKSRKVTISILIFLLLLQVKNKVTVTGVAFPPTHPGLVCVRVADVDKTGLLFSSFSLSVFPYNKLPSVPKHTSRELFVSGARGISIHKKQKQLCKIRCLMGDEQMENMRVLKLY